jgi:hypothetical protein
MNSIVHHNCIFIFLQKKFNPVAKIDPEKAIENKWIDISSNFHRKLKEDQLDTLPLELQRYKYRYYF